MQIGIFYIVMFDIFAFRYKLTILASELKKMSLVFAKFIFLLHSCAVTFKSCSELDTSFSFSMS